MLPCPYDCTTCYPTVYVLVDCNNFFVSCERIFRPDLEGRPVIVLSNNDGCVVARSAEVKRLGVPMGVAVFKIRDLIRAHHITVFSSNFPLYLDISERVMKILRTLAPQVEVYSVDEAFLCFHNLTEKEALETGYRIRNTLAQSLGMPVGVGAAASRTLAKLCSHHAKTHPECRGVYAALSRERREQLLMDSPLEEIWGVGRRLTERLSAEGMRTAWDLACADQAAVRRRYSVTLLHTQLELLGEDCLGDPEPRAAQAQIMWSRTFKERLTTIEQLKEAVSNYTAEAAVKLRSQGLYCRRVSLQIRTSLYDSEAQRYAGDAQADLSAPTSDTRLLIKVAGELLKKVFKPGMRYMRAGVILTELSAQRRHQSDLLRGELPAAELERADRLMAVMDELNRDQRHTVYLAAQHGFAESAAFKNPQHLSPRYTTDWDELPKLF